MGLFFILVSIFVIFDAFVLIKYVLLNKEISNIQISEDNLKKCYNQKFEIFYDFIECIKSYMLLEEDDINLLNQMRIKYREYSLLNYADEVDEQYKKVLKKTEKYQELHGNENFSNILNRISKVDEKIQIAEKEYNNKIIEYNLKLKEFPESIIAKFVDYREKEYYKFNYEFTPIPDEPFPEPEETDTQNNDESEETTEQTENVSNENTEENISDRDID